MHSTLKHRKVLVTGGAGYTGSHTVVALAKAGYIPVIVDNFVNADRRILQGMKTLVQQPLIVYEGDCSDKAFMERVFRQEQDIAAVIHFAAHKSVKESIDKPLMYFSNNIGALTTVLETMKAREIKHFILSSSCTVYGKPKKIPVVETFPFEKPESPYGHSKQMSEEILRAAGASGPTLKAVSLRYFNIIGAHPSGMIGEWPVRPEKNMVPVMMESAVGKRKAFIITGDGHQTQDGTCVRDYTHVMDIADAHVSALEHVIGKPDVGMHDAINLGTGKGYSVLDMVYAFHVL